MAFACVLVTPEQQTLSEQATQVILPAHDGLIGILTDRAPLLLKLGIGPLRVDGVDKKSRYFFIEGGVAQMKDNTLTILTTVATPADELDAKSAEAELAEAMARQIPTPEEFQERQRGMARARAKRELASRRG